MKFIRCPAPSVTPREGRYTPAATAPSGGTLTITPADGEAISVQPNGFNSPGFVQINAGEVAVFASAADQAIKSVVVKGAGVNNYTFTPGTGVGLTNLTVRGAKANTAVVTNLAVLSGNLSFVGTTAGTGTDDVTTVAGLTVNGSASFAMAGGTNVVRLTGNAVGGNLCPPGPGPTPWRRTAA